MRRFAIFLAAVMMAAMLTAAGSATGHAQDTALDRVQNLINTGRFTEARNTLEQWERGAGDARSSATTADRARALFLRGVLSTDPKDAEDAFVGVVLSYPSSAVAPAALLRLGQGLLAAGDARRAVAYLERLRSDYPGARERETGWLWLARAQHASGAATAACATAREGFAAASTANMRTLLELERDNVCAADGQARAATPTVPAPARDAAATPPAQRNTPVATPPAQGTTPPDATPPAQRTTPPAAAPPTSTPPAAASPTSAPPTAAPPTSAPPTTAPPTASPPTAAPPTAAPPTAAPPTASPPTASPPTASPPTAAPRAAASPAGSLFAVQTAAFRERSNAVSAAAQLRARGFVSRVVAVEGSPLLHVRFGSFATRAEADAAAQRIRDAGLTAIVVSDVRLER
jgi:cell division protein FtsN